MIQVIIPNAKSPKYPEQFKSSISWLFFFFFLHIYWMKFAHVGTMSSIGTLSEPEKGSSLCSGSLCPWQMLFYQIFHCFALGFVFVFFFLLIPLIVFHPFSYTGYKVCTVEVLMRGRMLFPMDQLCKTHGGGFEKMRLMCLLIASPSQVFTFKEKIKQNIWKACFTYLPTVWDGIQKKHPELMANCFKQLIVMLAK